jgi:hypothetical protein
MKKSQMTVALNMILKMAETEGLNVPYTSAEFEKEITDFILKKLPVKELLKRATVEERLEGISSEKLFDAIPEKDLLKMLHQKQFAKTKS